MKGKYERPRGQSTLVNKKIMILTAGIFLVSIAAHMAGFLTVKGIADDGIAVLWKWAFPLFFYMAGITCLISGIWQRQLIRPLLYLGGAYLGIQLILSFLMGGLALIFQYSFEMNGESVKTVVDMIVRIIQIPLRAGVCLFLMEQVIQGRICSLMSFIKLSAAFTLYTIIQYLAGFMGHSVFVLAVRVLAAGVITVVLWSYIYFVCRKAGEQNEK